MSALPAAVKRQVEQAQRLVESLGAPTGEQPPANGQVPPQQANAGEPPAAPPPVPQPPANAPAPQGEPQPNTPPAPPPAPPPVAQLPTDAWEQRYKVLQGKYNAEVPRLTSQVRELTASLNATREQVVQMQQLLGGQGGNPGQPAPQHNQPDSKLVRDEEVKEYGEDLYDFIKRAAREVVAPEVDQRIRPVAQRAEQASSAVSSVAREMGRTAEQRMYDMLAEQVPDWLQLNEDENFLRWLDQVDPFSGQQRLGLLRQAYGAHDGPRVVAFFKSFLNEHAAVTPPTAADGTPSAPQRSLEDMVAPGTGRAPSAGAQENEAGKKIWTRREIARFYRDISAGKYAKDPKTKAAIEADIFAAQTQGRIRQ